MATYEIDRMLHASTGHATQEDIERAQQSNGPDIVGYQFEYGVLVLIPNENNFADILLHNKWSEGFVKTLQLARNQNCQWVKFDQDGPVYEDLILYDW
jgi:hypothetical protein